MQRRAISAHEAGNGRTGDVAADLLLERAQYGIVEEGAALYDDMPAEVIGRMGTDDLVKRVLDDRHGQTGGDRVDSGAVLLRLLDRRVHKHGAARAEVDRMLRKQAELAELLDGVAHRARERLDKRAAAGRAGLVQRNVVDAFVADFEAFDVLTADVDDEIDVRLKWRAARKCATVSTRPKSTPNAFWMSASP